MSTSTTSEPTRVTRSPARRVFPKIKDGKCIIDDTFCLFCYNVENLDYKNYSGDHPWAMCNECIEDLRQGRFDALKGANAMLNAIDENTRWMLQ